MDGLTLEGIDRIMKAMPGNMQDSSVLVECIIELSAYATACALDKESAKNISSPMPYIYLIIMPMLNAISVILAQNEHLTERVASLTARLARLEGVEDATS